MDIQTLLVLFELIVLLAEIVVVFLLLTHFRKLDAHTEALGRHICAYSSMSRGEGQLRGRNS